MSARRARRRYVQALVVHDSDAGGTPGDAVLFIFDAGTTDRETFVVRADEIGEARFVAPRDLPDFLVEVVAARMTAALRARDAGTTAYLER